jgi:hypothetical protein
MSLDVAIRARVAGAAICAAICLIAIGLVAPRISDGHVRTKRRIATIADRRKMIPQLRASRPHQACRSHHALYVECREKAEREASPGACLSACTLAIGMLPRGQVCATPNAVLGFHAAWRPTVNGGKITSPVATQAMYELYPTNVREWIARRGGLSERTIFLKGRELTAMVRACDAGLALRGHPTTRTLRRDLPRSLPSKCDDKGGVKPARKFARPPDRGPPGVFGRGAVARAAVWRGWRGALPAQSHFCSPQCSPPNKLRRSRRRPIVEETIVLIVFSLMH